MRRRFYKFSTWVILSGAKDLTQAWLITLEKQRDANSVGEVPLSRVRDRDDSRSTRGAVPFTTC
jgi:hypothetical protein